MNMCWVEYYAFWGYNKFVDSDKLFIAPDSGNSERAAHTGNHGTLLLQEEISRVVSDVQHRMSIANFLNHPSEKLTNATLTDAYLLDFMQNDESDERTTVHTPAANSFQVRLKEQEASVAAAKRVIKNLGFNEKGLLSTIIVTQTLLRERANKAMAQSKIIDFFN